MFVVGNHYFVCNDGVGDVCGWYEPLSILIIKRLVVLLLVSVHIFVCVWVQKRKNVQTCVLQRAFLLTAAAKYNKRHKM